VITAIDPSYSSRTLSFPSVIGVLPSNLRQYARYSEAN
jgi:hypothetical protein